jgi:hypothetical protein
MCQMLVAYCQEISMTHRLGRGDDVLKGGQVSAWWCWSI